MNKDENNNFLADATASKQQEIDAKDARIASLEDEARRYIAAMRRSNQKVFALSVQMEKMRELRHELFGIAKDVDSGKEFDVVCRLTLERVIDALTIEPSSALRAYRLGCVDGALKPIAALMHYPDCWDTAAYPTLETAIAEVFHCSVCADPEAHGVERMIGPTEPPRPPNHNPVA